jgi:hypothetical protein
MSDCLKKTHFAGCRFPRAFTAFGDIILSLGNLQSLHGESPIVVEETIALLLGSTCIPISARRGTHIKILKHGVACPHQVVDNFTLQSCPVRRLGTSRAKSMTIKKVLRLFPFFKRLGAENRSSGLSAASQL